MAAVSIFETYLPIGESIVLNPEIHAQLDGKGSDFRRVMWPILNLAITSAALSDRPEVKNRQIKQCQAIDLACERNVPYGVILTTIRFARQLAKVM